MSATRSAALHQESSPTTPFYERAMSAVERAYGHLRRMPNSIYDMRKGKRLPLPVKHVSDYRQALNEGASRPELMELHELVGVEMESVFGDDPSEIKGRLYLSIQEAYRAEIEGECRANLMQAKAAMHPDLDTCEKALEVSLSELRTLKQYVRALMREIETRRMLEQHVGHAS